MMDLIGDYLYLFLAAFFVLMLIPSTFHYMLYMKKKDHIYPELYKKIENDFIYIPYFYLVALPSLLIRIVLRLPIKKTEPERSIAEKHETLLDNSYYEEVRKRRNRMHTRYNLSLLCMALFVLTVACVFIYGQSYGVISRSNLFISSALILLSATYLGVILYKKLCEWSLQPLCHMKCPKCMAMKFKRELLEKALYKDIAYFFFTFYPVHPFCMDCAERIFKEKGLMEEELGSEEAA